MMRDPVSSGGRFQRFCIAGLGHHARTKLIPALLANGQQIVGVVTSRAHNDLPAVPVFPGLDRALSTLPADTVFVIATPPAVHFDQAMAVIKAGRDLILEKPAFVTEAEATEAAAEAARRGSILVEAFMHRHTGLYHRLLTSWREEGAAIVAIDAAFLIPEMPAGTFRQRADIACSSLYDIGCYAISLLADLGLPLQALKLKNVDCPGACDREAVRLAGVLGRAVVDLRVGAGAAYVNTVSFRTQSGKAITFSPLFYGRAADKTISVSLASTATQEHLHDGNAYEAMFAVPRRVWLDGQPERLTRMTEIAATLQRLGGALERLRMETVIRDDMDKAPGDGYHPASGGAWSRE